MSMYFPNRLELSFRSVLAFPKALEYKVGEKGGAEPNCHSLSFKLTVVLTPHDTHMIKGQQERGSQG